MASRDQNRIEEEIKPAKRENILHNKLLLLLLSTMFLVQAGFGMIVPSLPYLAERLQASSMQMGLLVTVWAAAQFICAPIWGGLSDRIGRRPTLILGMIGMGATFLAMPFSPNIHVLIVIRLIGGAVSAATMPTAQAFIADVTPLARRGEAMAAMGASWGLGFLFGPLLGGVLSPLGTNATFFVGGGLALLDAIVELIVLPEPRREQPLERTSLSPLRGIGVAISSAQAIYYYLALLIAFNGSSLFSMMGYYLMQKMGAPQGVTAQVFVVQGLVSVVFQTLLVPRTLRDLGERIAIMIGTVCGIAGFATVALAPSPTWVMIGIVGTAGAMAFIRPALSSAISKETTLPQGITMGTQAAFDALGRTLGPLWAGFAFALFRELPFVSAAAIYVAGAAVTALLLLRPHLPMTSKTVDSEAR